ALYPARLTFPGTNLHAMNFSFLLGARLSGVGVSGLNVPLVALLGRDILRSFVLVYNGPGGGFTLAY
ncbi:MAG TPA: hypothetical protein VGK70_14890, partial [Thermoanaerobaculia bacterium]